MLQQLIGDHSLTSDEGDQEGDPLVDLGHEILISAWPTLAGWIQAHRVDEQRRRQLEAAAAQWVARGRGANGLLDPIELADAEKWQHTESAMQLGRSTDVLAFRAAHDRQRRHDRIIRTGIAGGVTAFVAVVAVFALIARWEARNANEQANIAREQTDKAKPVTARASFNSPSCSRNWAACRPGSGRACGWPAARAAALAVGLALALGRRARGRSTSRQRCARGAHSRR